jgi:hypothetical protein
MRRPLKRFLLMLCVWLAWSLISLHPIWKYLPLGEAVAATMVSGLMIPLGMLWLKRFYQRRPQLNIAWFVGLVAVLVVAFAILHPRSYTQPLKSRSDREDALRAELVAIKHHANPFDARTFLHNSPTPLPGALLLASPFFAVGHIAWQNVAWYALFVAFAMRMFRYRATALYFLAVFLLLCPTNLSDFVSGGDYLTNLFYVVIAVGLFVVSLEYSQGASLLAACAVGIALTSRTVYVFALIPLLAYTLPRRTRSQTVLLFGAMIFASITITLLILSPHPMEKLIQGLGESSIAKLRYIPASLHPQWTLPLLAALLASLAFFVRLDLHRIFLFLGITNGVVLAPYVITFVAHGSGQALSYLSASFLPLVLWALREYETTSVDRLGDRIVYGALNEEPFDMKDRVEMFEETLTRQASTVTRGTSGYGASPGQRL